MRIEKTAIPDVKIIHLDGNDDHRGLLMETYDSRAYADLGIDTVFVQDVMSRSRTKGTVRALHFQSPPRSQAKLARVTRGKALDVVVDLRQGSPTYGRHTSMVLDESDGLQVFIPIGFAHGFCTLADNTEMAYKLSDHFSQEHASGILWNDPDLGIDWPVVEGEAILSQRDRAYPRLEALGPVFHMPPG